MKYLLRIAVPLMFVFPVMILGCESASEDKQPKLQGPADSRIKGPATPGGGAPGKPGAATLD